MTKFLLLMIPSILVGCRTGPDFDEMKVKAENGDANAQNYLGTAYQHGEGVKQDTGEAIKWYQKAADQGLDQGQFYLGLMYYEAKGVTQDFKEAEKWFQKSANQGDSSAQGLLRDMYWRGKGVKQDRVVAYSWASITCRNDGRSHTEEFKNNLEKEMTKTQISKAQKLYQEMLKKNPKLIQKD